MEYHKTRFEDYSLLVFKDEDLVAVLPANKDGNTIISHQGLTYGGLILNASSTLLDTIEYYKYLLAYLEKEGIEMLELKCIPSMYCNVPSAEQDYIMFKLDAFCYRTDITSAIQYSNKLDITSSNRKRSLKRAMKNNLSVKEVFDFSSFWNDILIPNLRNKHNTNPTHSVDEISFLAEQFPNNIRQFNAYKEDKIVAGVTIFETPLVAHAQYISANEDKQELGSLDFLFNYLIDLYSDSKAYFDFGISNENQGQNINQGLLHWKESFGARSIAHQCYRIPIENAHLLNDVMI